MAFWKAPVEAYNNKIDQVIVEINTYKTSKRSNIRPTTIKIYDYFSWWSRRTTRSW